MRVLIIGAGKIASGYLCPLFLDAGWETVLVARNGEMADRIRAVGRYRVRIAGQAPRDVHGHGVVPWRTREFNEALAGADLVVTSVGVGKVAGLGAELARALAAGVRRSPLQFLLVENQDSAPFLERAVRLAAGNLGLRLPPVAFAGAVAEVVVARGDWYAERPQFVRDDAFRLKIDRSRLAMPLPRLPGVSATSHYEALLHEKLFVFNAGHALCAYLGTLRGHRFVHEAVHDPVLHPLIAGCLLESRRALLSLYPALGHDVRRPVAQALRRYANAEVADPLSRVARDPIRKLAPRDRLLGPAKLIRLASGCAPAHFALGIAGALLYRNPGDKQARRLAEMLAHEGLVSVLRQVCELEPCDELARAVERRYRGFVLSEAGTLFPPVYEPAELRATGEAAGL
jgi:mannitol-1-phosphate 5-dehydrogenase